MIDVAKRHRRDSRRSYSPSKTDDRDLGLLSDLREAVAMARRYHPELAHRHVVDVGLRREGDRIRATFFFSGSKSK